MKRVADGLSQADLASAIRMPREWIAAYENGDERILPAHLARFCDLFDVNPSFFFEGL
jgi:transcriptional regulator with XRE-family HTH domain